MCHRTMQCMRCYITTFRLAKKFWFECLVYITTSITYRWRFPTQMTKAYMGRTVLSALILIFGIGWRWVVSFTIRPRYLQRQVRRYALKRMLDWSQSQSGP